MRLIDADALIEFCAERWIPLNIDAVNMQPTIQPVATDTNVGNNSEIPNSSDCISRQQAIDATKDWYEGLICGSVNGLIKRLNALPTAQPEPQHERIFQEIVVEYPSYNTYPEYKGKPYFSIKYTENGQKFIGYGTYKPEVLSQYLKEYFMPTAQPEPQWIPVSERLPRDGTWNIFTDGKNISVERYKADAIDHFFPNGRWFQLEDVIAWMPLPTPYTK